jgi:hypothetical protein
VLRQCRDAQPNFVAGVHACDVALIDAKFKLERVSASNDGKHVARIRVRADAFLGSRREHDSLNRGANDARLDLFVEHFGVAPEDVRPQALQALFRRIAVRRADRRSPLCRRDRGKRRIALGSESIVSEVGDRRSTLDGHSLANEYAIDDA